LLIVTSSVTFSYAWTMRLYNLMLYRLLLHFRFLRTIQVRLSDANKIYKDYYCAHCRVIQWKPFWLWCWDRRLSWSTEWKPTLRSSGPIIGYTHSLSQSCIWW